MSVPARCAIYHGQIVHKRLVPRRHGFAYRVFTLAMDVDEIGALDQRLRLFSHNRFNILSFYDLDHGPGELPVGDYARGLLGEAGLVQMGHRIVLLCYPRVFGFVFNPLSIFCCYNAGGRLGALIYEVTNTFGSRRSYIVPVRSSEDAVVAQNCSKAMYVSPFNSDDGSYSFRIRPPGDEVLIAVALRTGLGPTLKTNFRGYRLELSDGNIFRMVIQHPLMTFKVISAIHFEAVRLWLKGLRVKKRSPAPPFSTTIVLPGSEGRT